MCKHKLGEVTTSRVGIGVVEIALRVHNVWDIREGDVIPGAKISLR